MILGGGVTGLGPAWLNSSLVATKIGAATGFTDGQLNGGTTYQYYIRAFDGAGNVSFNSNLKLLTTPAMPALHRRRARQPQLSGYRWHRTHQWDQGGQCHLCRGVAGPKCRWYPHLHHRPRHQQDHQLDQQQLAAGAPHYVFLPVTVTFLVSADGVNYTTAGIIPRSAVTSANEIKTLRLISLSLTGRYVRVQVDGASAWTMLDEVEVRQA